MSEQSVIERIAAPSREVFEREFVAKNRPVIMTGVVDRWKAMGWTQASLAAAVQDHRFAVDYYADGNYQTRVDLVKKQDVSMAEYFAILAGQEKVKERYYLQEVDILGDLPMLAGDVEMPAYWDAEDFHHLGLFIGKDSTHPLHKHALAEAMLFQIAGTKKLRMFAPDQGPYLYPGRKLYGFSRVDPFQPDHLEKFPKYAKAKGIEITMRPGEMLFIPIHWWHLVWSEGFTISMTSFWKSTLKRIVLPRASLLHTLSMWSRMIPTRYDALIRMAKADRMRRKRHAARSRAGSP